MAWLYGKSLVLQVPILYGVGQGPADPPGVTALGLGFMGWVLRVGF